MRNNKERNITRYQVAELTANSCGNAASVSHGSSRFKATRNFCFNANVIPDFYSIEKKKTTYYALRDRTTTSESKKSRGSEQSASSTTDGIDI
jgi:hypothetical protein